MTCAALGVASFLEAQSTGWGSVAEGAGRDAAPDQEGMTPFHWWAEDADDDASDHHQSAPRIIARPWRSALAPVSAPTKSSLRSAKAGWARSGEPATRSS